MADLIIIRIHPVNPSKGTDFRAALTGLQIDIFDRSYGQPAIGTKIGSAVFNTPDVNNGVIVQHYDQTLPFPPLSVATAAIVVRRPVVANAEYQTADLLLKITRNGIPIADRSINYNIDELLGIPLPLPGVAGPGDSDTKHAAAAVFYMGLGPTALYWAMPTFDTDPNKAHLQVPDDGTPPNFTELRLAVEKVLAADPTGPVDLTKLTVEQCRNIAYEIIWNRTLLPLPVPPGGDTLEKIYTVPASDADDQTKHRQRFEADLTQYYTIHNGQSELLTKYVYALSAALACQVQSNNADPVGFTFPILLGGPQSPGKIAEATVGLSGAPLGFIVPAPYFYALASTLPFDIGTDLRFRMATITDPKQVVITLRNAVNANVISDNSPAVPTSAPSAPPAGTPITIEQAARRLHALAAANGVKPVCAPGVGTTLRGHWLAYASNDTGDPLADLAGFWSGNPTPLTATDLSDHRDLVICAITKLSRPNQAPDNLVTAIQTAGLPIASTADLKAITTDQWTTIFSLQLNASLLVDVTGPGSIPQRVARWIRLLTKFFNVVPSTAPAPTATVGGPPQLDKSINDPIVAFLSYFTLGFKFGQAPLLDPSSLPFQSAVAQVFPNDEHARMWLAQTLLAIDTLYFVTDIVGSDDATHFSLVEALYARGFTDKASITALTQTEFAAALSGTVAYAYAGEIQKRAGGAAPSSQPGGGSFRPINPGDLTNCLPPPELSPLGPVAYLHGLWKLSSAATCDDLVGSTGMPPVLSLGGLVLPRRGLLGELSVTRANLETPLPMIDLVNECLEAMAATSSANGVVYDTASDQVGDHLLRQSGGPPDEQRHDPATLFGAIAEHSSPATPVAQPQAYVELAQDFSSWRLPYSQPLDVNRSYLDALHTTRFLAMRHLRKDISEFVLDPAAEPATFPRHRWRYPVRIEIACEYLRVLPAEYELLYTSDLTAAQLQTLLGFPATQQSWVSDILVVSELLARTGLSYCEFLELQRSRFVNFQRQSDDDYENHDFPDCPPCYLEKEWLVFPGPTPLAALNQLVVFIRLWRTLRDVPHARYSFATLRDICNVLQLFRPNGEINPDFIRQLAAFQMLRDDLHLELSDPQDPTTTGVDAARTHILSLWVGPAASKWQWALEQLLDRVEHRARRFHLHEHGPIVHKLLIENLDPLSLLAGFDPALPTDTWWAVPTHTLRFAEVLVKIYASRFGVGEIIYLLTADEHLDGDDPFPLPADEESIDDPLELPDDVDAFSLWKLRRELLQVHVSDEEVEHWTWPRIEAALRDRFGFQPPPGSPDPLQSLGEHFFPHLLEHHGQTVAPKKSQYRVPLVNTTAAIWNTPLDGPFQYDAGAQELIAELPLRDEAVLLKLSRIRQLSDEEQYAVRDLYFLPRLELVPFAFLFSNFEHAEERLIRERDERERWHFFRRQFALAYKRGLAIANHLAAHVDSTIGGGDEHGPELAWRLLRSLLADENRAQTPWEDDSGNRPDVTWGPSPGGGAFAALLGLVGTGLLGELRDSDGQTLVWRELRGPMDAFGHVHDEWNAPVPTVLPSMGATLTFEQQRYTGVRNGIMLANRNAERLGGAETFCATWRGVLMIEEAGSYRFWGGGPTPDGQKPDVEHVHNRRWRVTLRRGQRSWVLLAHKWAGEDVSSACSAPLALKRGAYDLVIELVQCPPTLDDLEDVRPQHTGFQLKYEGPDTRDELVRIPFHRLFITEKDTPLDDGVSEVIAGNAHLFLRTLYVSSLRDMRRTYQRAFKALLFARRFRLSAHLIHDYGQSEIGYLLDHPDNFAGISFYRSDGAWTAHLAGFDFNFLPLLDNYHPPQATEDDRVAPSTRRKQALFDIWERIFDYALLRREVSDAPARPVWLLFDEAAEDQPDNPAQLLRHVDIDLSHAPLVLRFYRGYDVTAADLMDERWAIRVWRADEWLDHVIARFLFADVRIARPDLWASDDPSVVEAGDPESGNQNLTRVVQDGLIENGQPRRYQDLQRLNDGLRERARRALLAYLCGMDRVQLPDGTFATAPKQLSELLLLDVEAGICERASRIDEGITAMQTFVQRARLQLEPSFTPTPEFVLLWERWFETFRVWQACARRALYRENWIEWDELESARRTEGFRFLEGQLRRATLTAPVPGGLEYWDSARPPGHPGLELLQSREPSTLKQIPPPQPLPAYDEGLNLLGTPARDARRSWLAPLPMTIPDDSRGGRDDDRGPRTPAAAPGGTLSAPVVSRLARAAASAQGSSPWWLEAAIRLGTRFIRVAAAGIPPAAAPFTPRTGGEGCCRRCGCEHEPLVDELYFWLIDSRWYDKLEGDTPNDPDAQEADTPGWHEASKLPTLLAMPSKPMVHLMWARIHNGELEAPRRSAEGVRVLDGTLPSDVVLEFAGRTLDSLRFVVRNGVAPLGYNATPSAGFRYDLATDAAIVLPQVGAPAQAVPPPWGGLPAYPYFGYFTPGAPLFPLTPFSEVTSVAAALRAHCRFEAALAWYSVAFDPLRSDVDWCPQARTQRLPPDTSPSSSPRSKTQRTKSRRAKLAAKRSSPKSPATPIATAVTDGDRPLLHAHARQDDLCCRDAAVPDDIARDRAITLDYLDTLFTWGECLMRHNSPESFQHARLLFDTAAKILGPMPRTIEDDDELEPPPKVSDFYAAHAPLNPRLISLYERVYDRLALIHACNNAHRLYNGRPGRDMDYFGDDRARDGWRTIKHVCDVDCECCCPPSPYRFGFLIERAKDLSAQVSQLGAALLSAFEKGDAEYLAYVRAEHEKQLLQLQLEIRQNQLRDSDWQVQALQKTKEIAQTNLNYYQGLINIGLIPGETDYQSLTNAAIASRTTATVLDAICEVMNFIPDVHVGTVDFIDLPIGTKLSRVFATGARISNEVAEILSITAGLRLTEAGWDRRLQEWQHQVDVLTIEIEQIERQILGAERRRAISLRELNNHRLQIEQSREMLNILRDKFTNHQLYLFLQKETAALHYQMYELALCCARQAQRAFNYERGHTARRFVESDAWDNLREGLLAGERLQLGLRRMEKAYYDENEREYELTKYLSLALGFGRQFLELKRTGKCEIELPEWLFDLDYPGQYMRRIKNVSLTIPCVTGPYAGVHCRLTLLSSTTRIDPRLHGPVTPCCEHKEPKPTPRPPCDCFPMPRALPEPKHIALSRNGYVPLPDDPRIVKEYAAKEAIATSTGQNDAGLFELNFRDERYLPFEFAGAVSRWRIELPQENNFFDVDTLSDVVMQLKYTAREGGDLLRRAAHEIAQEHIPDDGIRLFDLQRDFANEWQRLQARTDEDQPHTRFKLQLERRHFPFLPGHRAIWIKRLELFFEAEGAEPSTHHEVEFALKHKHGCKFAEQDEHEFQCVGSHKWPELFHGAVDAQLGPLHGRHKLEGEFRFGHVRSRIRRAWLLCHYETL